MTLLSSRTAIVLAVGILCMAAPVAAATSSPPTTQQTQSVSLSGSKNPFQVIDPSSDEYHALQRLMAAGLVKENAALMISGRPLTRYQAAIVAAEAINNAKTLMHDGNGKTLNSDELATLAVVYDDVKDDLTALTQRVDADERRIAALENGKHQSGGSSGGGDQGAPTTEFKPSFEIHGEFRTRPVLQSIQQANAVTFTGAPVPPGTTLTRTGGPGDAFITTGSNGMGQFQSRMRLVADGHIAPRADFIVRLATEDISGANNVSFVHNDFSFFDYHVPNTGWDVFGGKLLYCCATPWLPDGTGMIADAVPIGVAVKYTQPGTAANKFSGWASVGALKNAQTPPTTLTCPTQTTGLTQNITMAHLEYAFGPTWKVGVQGLSENSQCVFEFTDRLLTNNTTLSVGSLTLDHQFSKYFGITLEALARFGKDPVTAANWTDNGAYWASARYGLFGVPYGSGIDATYIQAGKNSVLGNLDSTINGVDSPWNFFLPYPNNVRTIDVGYQWNFDSNALVRLEYASAQLINPERDIAGNLIQFDKRNLLILTGLFNF